MQAHQPITIGYIRVSSISQNIERQLDGQQLTVTFTDRASGKDTNRPQLQALLAGNWPAGSVVVVHSMDRLARSLTDLLNIVQQLTARKIDVHFVKEGKTFRGAGTTDAMDMLMLSMLGAVAAYERELIRERQREGIAKAKQRGAYKGGCKKIRDPALIAHMVGQARKLGANKTRIAAEHGITRETLYKYMAQSSNM
jgi:DNA invertase Pin-like site-specific DNA recombinase